MKIVTVELLKPEGYIDRWFYHQSKLKEIYEKLTTELKMEDRAARRVIAIYSNIENSHVSFNEIAWEMTEADLMTHYKLSRFTTYNSFMANRSYRPKRSKAVIKRL